MKMCINVYYLTGGITSHLCRCKMKRFPNPKQHSKAKIKTKKLNETRNISFSILRFCVLVHSNLISSISQLTLVEKISFVAVFARNSCVFLPYVL